MSKPTHKINGQIVSCDPGNPEFYNNPYPVYNEMRAIGPCFFWEEYDIWCFAHHAQVNAILRDRRFGRQLPDSDLVANAPHHLKEFYAFEANSILELEPPHHTRLRRLINRAFVSRKIETLRPKIEKLSHHLIDQFENSQPVDLLKNFAETIPVHVIADMLGIATSNSDQLLSWSHAMVAMYQHNRSRAIEEAAAAATAQFSQFILEVVAERRISPTFDLISHLIAEQNKGEALSDEELVTTCILLLNAGHEATVHAIGNGVKTLLENTNQPAALFSDGNNHAAICEEILRFDPPLHKFTRFVLEDLEIGGRQFIKGETIGLLLGAANRDPQKFENPNILDFNRPGLAAANMAFGAGIHFCIGAPLARLEMQIALPILFKRLPKIHLARQPQYADRYHFHGLENLQIAW
ncbi:MAG: cytochrome P450 [Rhizobiaceae bacterium]|nr:cytochrome P450 [Rhizobiaceae bacterium]